MKRSPQIARMALTLALDLGQSAYRRADQFHDTLISYQGNWPTTTQHGGGGRGGNISDPTGQAAINPRSDPARLDLHQAYADLSQATRLLIDIDRTIAGQPPLPHYAPRIRTAHEAKDALDAVDEIVNRLPDLWPAWHAQAVNGDPLDLAETYADLDQAVDLLGNVHDYQVRWLLADPIRVHCANPACPDRNPPAPGQRRCWACTKYFQRTRRMGLGPDGRGEERTRTAERALDAHPTASQEPADGPPGPETGVSDPEPSRAATAPHSAPIPPGFGFSAWLNHTPPTEGAA